MHTTKTILAILMGSLILSGRLLAQRGVLRAVDRADYQYFIAPTGFVPKPGDRLFRSSNIALNQLQLVQNGGGILGIGFLFRKPLWAIGQTHFPKFRNRGPVYNVAAVFVETPEDDERGSDLGAVFSSVTLGNRQKRRRGFGAGRRSCSRCTVSGNSSGADPPCQSAFNEPYLSDDRKLHPLAGRLLGDRRIKRVSFQHQTCCT